jgi:aminoglycoside phosphotransferase
MIDALRTWLAASAPEALGNADAAAGRIVLAGDRHPEAKVTILLFDDAGVPAVVVKLPRGGSAGTASITAEHHALLQLHGALGADGTSLGLPAPLAFGEVAGRLALAESVVPGSPLTTRYYRGDHVTNADAVEADLLMVADWLRRFRSASDAGTVQMDTTTFEAWIGSVFSKFAATFGWDQRLEDLLAEIQDRARELEGCRIPIAGAHGDLAIANVLVDGNRVSGVVDWELGATGAPPFGDIYKFPLSYGGFLDRAAPAGGGRVAGHPGRHEIGVRWSRYGEWPNLIGFAYTFFGEGWFPDLIRSFVSQELEALGLPATVNSVFFPTFLAHQAMVLPDPVYRDGYRRILQGFAAERTRSWLWRTGARAA